MKRDPERFFLVIASNLSYQELHPDLQKVRIIETIDYKGFIVVISSLVIILAPVFLQVHGPDLPNYPARYDQV